FFSLYRLYILMIIYIVFLVFILNLIKLWGIDQLKDTIYWVFGGAFVMFFNINKASESDNYFYNLFKDSFNILLIIEFFSNLYSFPLIIEFISLPLILTFSLITSFKKIDKSVVKLSTFLLRTYIVSVIIYSTILVINDYKVVFTTVNLKTLIAPSIMTILFIPFLYFIALYMAYEIFFKMKKYILNDNPQLFKFLFWHVIKRCSFNLQKIRLVNKKLHVYSSIEKSQIIDELNQIMEKI
ncbi:MAG: hypothetical protein KDD24_08955, partial [Flavobacteriales bacterium]|nr:hypothetical protein [Flavobacteriales bacterium]